MKTTAFLLLGFLVATPGAFAQTCVSPDGSGGYIAQDLNDGSTTIISPDGGGGYVAQDLDDGSTSIISPDGGGGYIVQDLDAEDW